MVIEGVIDSSSDQDYDCGNEKKVKRGVMEQASAAGDSGFYSNVLLSKLKK